MTQNQLPVAIIGGGPVGLAAAAHLAERGLPFVIFEAGAQAGQSVLAWGHVQLFSPWRYCIDPAAARLLEPAGWQSPDPEAYPNGRALAEQYLAPLAAHPTIAPHLRLNSRVVGVTRAGFDKMKTAGRAQAPFLLHIATADGEEQLLARAVLDASGTYATPNPLGATGLPAAGERAVAANIFYGIPDVLGNARARYAGKRVLVAGSGHSAFNAILDLVALTEQAPATSITWVVRRGDMGQAYGGGADDALPARGELGQRIRSLVERGVVRLVGGWYTDRLARTAEGIVVSAGERRLEPVDEIVVATGLRPDLGMLSELRLGLDPAVEAPSALAPMIDPNVHSCGTVRPHGVDELSHPEPNFYIVGMKSYGRAPTFLLLTGYEQVRSVAAALAGDWEAARRVELVLPETGVCSGPGSAAEGAACCAPASVTPAAKAGLIELTPVTFSAVAQGPRGGAAVGALAPIAVAAEPAVALVAEPAGCCGSEVQATCCAPEDKAGCCGSAPSGSCGCQ